MPVVLSDSQLNDVDRRVLGHLADGRVTPQYVADREEVSRSYISQRLKRLVEHEHVARVAPALYELTDDPRDGSGLSETAADTPDRAADLERQLAACRAECERLHDHLEAIKDARIHADRALDALPEGAPGRTAVADLRTRLRDADLEGDDAE